MPAYLLLLPILLPLVSGALLYFLGRRFYGRRRVLVAVTVCLNTLLTWALILFCGEESFRILNLVWDLEITLRFDGFGRFFAGLVATLWPLTTFYGFGYMDREHHKNLYYAFFTMSFGVTLGVAMSGNLLTLYVFYELLTLVTVPLVMHKMTRKAVRAARIYLAFSIGGAAFAFIGILYLAANGVDLAFLPGGSVRPGGSDGMFRLIYLIAFLGFGVKAAIFPMHRWLPEAAVAPTPVTALLHAVAVVKSGAFAIIRLTYYCYGTDLLAGSWAQTAALCFAMVTILYGSYMSLRQAHWKRRLAYSTVSNLSYVVFGALLMTPVGLTGSLLHMLFHAVIKILGFFCVGAVLCNTGREYVTQLEGMGRRMPVTFVCFTVSALALTGIPPLPGFFSKWALLTAAPDAQSAAAPFGTAVLLVSAFLTAMYMIPTAVRAFFPSRDADLAGLDGVREVSPVMWVPMAILAAMTVALGLAAGPLSDFVSGLAASAF